MLLGIRLLTFKQEKTNKVVFKDDLKPLVIIDYSFAFY